MVIGMAAHKYDFSHYESSRRVLFEVVDPGSLGGGPPPAPLLVGTIDVDVSAVSKDRIVILD